VWLSVIRSERTVYFGAVRSHARGAAEVVHGRQNFNLKPTVQKDNVIY
jgi:hypothetical protein